MICAFVTPSTPPFNLAFNRVAAAVTGGSYCHTEVAFEKLPLRVLRELRSNLVAGAKETLASDLERAAVAAAAVLDAFPPNTPDDHEITLAFHAFAGCPLGCRVLSKHATDPLYEPYSDEWRVYHINGAPSNVIQANLVWSLSKCGLPYDTMGALTSPWRGANTQCDAPDPEHWFCSNLALRFLQHMNMCSDLSMWGTTPNRLEVGLRQYKGAAAGVDEKSESLGGQENIVLGRDHWNLVSSVIPYIIRAKLRLLQ